MVFWRFFWSVGRARSRNLSTKKRQKLKAHCQLFMVASRTVGRVLKISDACGAWRFFGRSVATVAISEHEKTPETEGVLSIVHGRQPNCRSSSKNIRCFWCFDDILVGRLRNLSTKKTSETQRVLSIFHGRQPNCRLSSKNIRSLRCFDAFFGRSVAAGREIWAQKTSETNCVLSIFRGRQPNCRSSSKNIRCLLCFDDFFGRPVAAVLRRRPTS